jgi:hypothetical protein
MKQRLQRNSLWCAVLMLAATGAWSQEAPVPQSVPSVTEDEKLAEPDYATVAADARKIADEIEKRLIDMGEASTRLSEKKALDGHVKAEEAATDMKEMIKVCESASGGAGSACKFKLEIKMGMNAGNTLGQLGAGMKPGASGLTGNGQSGQGGGGAPFGMFGPDQFGEKNNSKSRMLGDRKAKSDAEIEEPGKAAQNVDEVSAAKKFDVDFEASGGERVMEEYRGHIDQYFKKLAEEEAKK